MAPPTDPRLDRDTTNCSIARTLELVGEKWTLLVLREIWYGLSRFSDLHQMLGCPRNLLAERLRKLVDHGILATETYQPEGSRSRSRYVITDKGNDLIPAVLGLLQWGDKYRAAPEGPAIVNRHHGCGAALSVQVRCEHDHHVPPAEIDITPGPGFRARGASDPPHGGAGH
ncbi:HxlR family transcriptional regulator [Actinoplanes sp. OR16]|uniref:winged helix-turn-helix transcriptional regulator n=1 Tax=Actinoplanes sp. OR16 TaxID=946334 RepID=UPI000F6F1CE0|nr:helix-turn-helix domain-containing protein [Actinoplanes sp. OR16]BBH67776.1 HxlR family transcriptional regulator [Actinoplanes sp. OR16]